MPAMETITIINKSGKVVSTGKQLVNIFKDAKDAYETKKKEKKEEMKAQQQKRIAYKAAQNLIEARQETESVASSRRSHRSSRSSRHHKDKALTSRPPLSHIPEGSVSSSHRSRSARPHTKRRSSADESRRSILFEEGPPGLSRRHTDLGAAGPTQLLRTETLPPPYSLHRSVSDPDVRGDKIDMNLAYGELHERPASRDSNNEAELEAGLSKLDSLLLEAHCIQHSATTIIANLQKNPEAMAAVALTLAELSNILKTMGPAVLTSLKASSPAAFALLASPQFLIAGGVALGVTIVMFGGYKIVKQIKANKELAAAQEANRMEEELAYDTLEVDTHSVESWRRGIAEVEAQSVAMSVEGEFITPGAAKLKSNIRERAKEERSRPKAPESVASERSVKTRKSVRRTESASDIRTSTFATREIPIRSSTSKMLPAPSESGRSKHRESKSKELVVVSSEKKKKSSALSVFLNKQKEKKGEKVHRSRPQLIEM